MPRAQDWFSLSRPGEGPLVVTLTGVLLINLTVLTVLVGVNDYREQEARQQAAAIPLQTGTVTPASRLTPINPRPAQPAVQSSAPRPTVQSRTQPVAATPPAARPQPVLVPPATLEPTASVADEPQPAPPVAATTPQPQAEPQAPPVTFFGVPIE